MAKREPRIPRKPGEPRDPRDMRQPGDIRDPRDMRQPGDIRDPRDMRQPGDIRDPRDMRQPGDPADSGNGKIERRLHRILGIVFTLLGLLVSIDLLHLTLQFQTQHETLTAQTTCNQNQSDALVTIGRARRDVDSAALFYDETLKVFLETPVKNREPDDPATLNMYRALNLLINARKQAVNAYEQNPFPDCH